ncbi:acetyl-CoA synthetase-like protein [Xylaria venustula]|nr:acetyl-CoA synthetase-like protein [Xylaria venustula]
MPSDLTDQARDHPSGQRGLSIVHGRQDVQLLELDLGLLIRNQSKRFKNRPAVIAPFASPTRWTYRELEEKSKTLAKALLSMGFSKGDRVGIFSGNTPEYCALVFAAGRIGAILVVLNLTYTPFELHRALKHTECKALFLATNIGGGDNAHLEFLYNAPDLLMLEQFVLLNGEEHGTRSRCIQYNQLLSLSESISDETIENAERNVNQHDVCNLQFTSGTTGNPKAVMLTHHGIINSGNMNALQMGLSANDVLGSPAPLYHCSGLVLGLLAAITQGAAVVFPSPVFDPLAVIQCVQVEHCTALLGVPTMWVAYLQHLKPGWDFSGVKTGISGGSSVPRPLMEDIQSKLKMTGLKIAYGMTETSPTAFMTSRFDSMEKQLTTVGQVLPHTAAKVVDAEGRIVPIGHRGEICFSGYLLQKGYWRDQEQTAKVMKLDSSGVLWMHSGDEGFLDAERYCTVTGRIKDIIIRGGENIYPPEIEERLMQHPSIASAVVIGVKNSKYGEIVGSFLEPQEGTEIIEPQDIRAWVRERLAYHKTPVHIFWVGAGGSLPRFPLTGSGKVQKERLREIANNLVHRRGRRSKL